MSKCEKDLEFLYGPKNFKSAYVEEVPANEPKENSITQVIESKTEVIGNT